MIHLFFRSDPIADYKRQLLVNWFLALSFALSLPLLEIFKQLFDLLTCSRGNPPHMHIDILYIMGDMEGKHFFIICRPLDAHPVNHETCQQ